MGGETAQLNELPWDLSPNDAPVVVERLIEQGYSIPGLSRPLDEEEIGELEFGHSGFFYWVSDPSGRMVALPLCVGLYVEGLFLEGQTTRLSQPLVIHRAHCTMTYNPRLIVKGDEHAVEKAITLYELALHLESIRDIDGPKAAILGLFVGKTNTPVDASDIERGTELLPKWKDGCLSFYDYLCLVVPGKIFAEDTVYPTPAFLEGAFDLSEGSIPVSSLIGYLLGGRYVDRVVVVPRVRYRDGQYLEHEIFDLVPYIVDRLGGHFDYLATEPIDHITENTGFLVYTRDDLPQP